MLILFNNKRLLELILTTIENVFRAEITQMKRTIRRLKDIHLSWRKDEKKLGEYDSTSSHTIQRRNTYRIDLRRCHSSAMAEPQQDIDVFELLQLNLDAPVLSKDELSAAIDLAAQIARELQQNPALTSAVLRAGEILRTEPWIEVQAQVRGLRKRR